MAKILKPTQINRCNGCEMCIFEAQRQLKKVGLEDSLIRVFRKKNPETRAPEFELEIDPRINILDVEKIASLCPKKVFEIQEEIKND